LRCDVTNTVSVAPIQQRQVSALDRGVAQNLNCSQGMSGSKPICTAFSTLIYLPNDANQHLVDHF
jgi:hypothetical protein